LQAPAARPLDWARRGTGFGSATGFGNAATRAASIRSTMFLCGATFVGGIAVFAGALLLHTRYDLYGSNRYIAPDGQNSNAAVLAALAKRRRDAAER
jgi:hypothetical protein